MNKNYFLSRLICILILQAILFGQKQFGRIFIENENPLFKKNTKDITVKEKREILGEGSNTVEIEDSIAIEPKVLSPKPKEENLSKFDNVDSIKSKNKMVSKAIVKTEKKIIKKLKVVLPSDSIVTKRGFIYRTDTKEKFSGKILEYMHAPLAFNSDYSVVDFTKPVEIPISRENLQLAWYNELLDVPSMIPETLTSVNDLINYDKSIYLDS